MSKQYPTIYLAQVQGARLGRQREALRVKLDLLKQMPHDKQEYKKQKAEIVKQMNALTFDMEGKLNEVYQQNYQVVLRMLMMFCGMDFLTRLCDEAADVFKSVTVGPKQGELLDFVKMFREAARKANNVVQIIDEAGNEMMSMAYADMEDGIGERLLNELRQHVDDYGKSPAGRKYFYGDHLKH